MTRIFKNEYTQFLQQFDLLENFMTFLLNVCNQPTGKADEQLVSKLMLELRADYLREMAMTNNGKSFGDNKDGPTTLDLFSSEDGTQFYAMRSESAGDIFHFKTQLQFGANEGKVFSGNLYEDDPARNQNGIFMLPSSKLEAPYEATMKILKAASVIITDDALKIDSFMKILKVKISQDTDRWKNCAETRFIFLSAESFKKLQSVARSSLDKNTDLNDRGYFLGQIFKNIGSHIWDKVDKTLYKNKYAAIGADNSFEDVSTIWAMQILAELIEQKFSEDESGIQQIAIMEIFEQIRSDKSNGQAEPKENEASTDNELIELSKKNSEKFMEEVQAQKSLPNFESILTQTEKLVSDISENFYFCDEP